MCAMYEQHSIRTTQHKAMLLKIKIIFSIWTRASIVVLKSILQHALQSHSSSSREATIQTFWKSDWASEWAACILSVCLKISQFFTSLLEEEEAKWRWEELKARKVKAKVFLLSSFFFPRRISRGGLANHGKCQQRGGMCEWGAI